MKRRLVLQLAVLGFFALPQHAWANAGTPLMWVEMFHLAIGNAFIGLVEGLLLGRLFGVPWDKATKTMIVANYASAWLGGVFIRGTIVSALPMDITNGWLWFWVMVAVTYCLTLLLEWPFVVWCFRGTPNRLARSIRASFVIQSVSCFFLFGGYWTIIGTSLYTEMCIAKPKELTLPESVFVYFIAPDDGNVYRRELAGRGGVQRVCELHSTDSNDRLFVRPNAADPGRWDLMARLETSDRHTPRFIEVLTNMLVEAAQDWGGPHTNLVDYKGTWFNFGEVQGLGAGTNGQWTFWTGFWALEGLRGANTVTGERVRFSYETPFGAWIVRNAVHLPTDKVLFQLGDDQICAFDPVKRRIALLWRGRGPVPVIEKTKYAD